MHTCIGIYIYIPKYKLSSRKRKKERKKERKEERKKERKAVFLKQAQE